MDKLSRIIPSSCCGYRDATDLVVMILYFHCINTFLDAFSHEKSKWIRRMWRPEDKASWLIHRSRKLLFNQLHVCHEQCEGCLCVETRHSGVHPLIREQVSLKETQNTGFHRENSLSCLVSLSNHLHLPWPMCAKLWMHLFNSEYVVQLSCLFGCLWSGYCCWYYPSKEPYTKCILGYSA